MIGFEPDRDPPGDGRPGLGRAGTVQVHAGVRGPAGPLSGGTDRPGARDADCVLGSFTAGAELIKSRFEAYGKFPVKRRLQMIADDLHSRFSSDRELGDEAPGARPF